MLPRNVGQPSCWTWSPNRWQNFHWFSHICHFHTSCNRPIDRTDTFAVGCSRIFEFSAVPGRTTACGAVAATIMHRNRAFGLALGPRSLRSNNLWILSLLWYTFELSIRFGCWGRAPPHSVGAANLWQKDDQVALANETFAANATRMFVWGRRFAVCVQHFHLKPQLFTDRRTNNYIQCWRRRF